MSKAIIDHAQECLARVSKDNERLNIVLSLNPHLLDEAEVVQQKINEGKAGKLAGKIIGIKSCICVEGLQANCGSRTLEGWISPYDADVIDLIKKEDGLILGMLNMDEFACGISGETSAFGSTVNPRSPEYVPGGSSSGSAAAVAAGFCDISLGTDTGGSIRNPASHCGVVGVKPTYACVSRYGLIDLSMSLDQIGPFAKTVDDAALLLSVISKRTGRDSIQRDQPMPDVFSSIPLSDLRIGQSPALRALCTDERISALIEQKVQQFFQKFESHSVSVDLEYVELAVQTYYPLVYTEFFSATRKFDGRKYGKKIEDSCGTEVLRRLVGGSIVTHAEHQDSYYKKALAAKQLISEQIHAAFDHCDVLILPVTPRLPHKLGEKLSVEDAYAFDALTIPANLAGICAGVVPAGLIDGVPVGLQVYAPAGREDVLFSVLRGFESLKK